MTRDEVLEQAADALASEAVDDAFATLREGPAIVRALKSKPPEKYPEVEAPKDTGTAFGEIYEALDCLKEHLARGRPAETERDSLRRSLEWFQDRERYFAQVLGVPDGGQLREDWGTRIQALIAERDAIRRQLPQYDCTHTGGSVSDSGGKHCPPESPCLTCRLERAETEVSNLRWQQSGSPMKGE